jgi:hypothetical protein
MYGSRFLTPRQHYLAVGHDELHHLGRRRPVFSGLIAYDTQKVKEDYAQAWGTDTAEKVAILGALNLYLDFVKSTRGRSGSGRSSRTTFVG